MSSLDFQFISGPLHMLAAGMPVEELESQLKIVAIRLGEMQLDDLGHRVYELRFAEDMPNDQLQFELKTLLRSLEKRIQ